MVNIYVDPDTGLEYQEDTTNTETLPDGAVIKHSTWTLVSNLELNKEDVPKKKVGRPSKNK